MSWTSVSTLTVRWCNCAITEGNYRGGHDEIVVDVALTEGNDL